MVLDIRRKRSRRDQGGLSLRRRIAVGTLSVASIAVLLFALPLGVAVQGLDRSREYAELQSQATSVAGLVPDNAISSVNSVPVPVPATQAVDRGSLIGIYTPKGVRVGGRGPDRSSLAAAVSDGRVHHGGEAGQLGAAVPVPSDRNVVAVVRAATPLGQVNAHTHHSWAVMALLALGVLFVTGLLAASQARRIARPLERLTGAARALGDGNFAVDLPRSGIREADIAGQALEVTAERLGRLLERERAFSADASHQLRTPLTGLLLGLESALSRPGADPHAALRDALQRARHLQETVNDLLALRRDVRPDIGSLDLAVTAETLAGSWQQRFAANRRHLIVAIPSTTPAVLASAPALRQILDVLLDNALRHGAGTVTLSAADLGEAIAVDISDEGDGLVGDPEAVFTRRSPHARGHGIGLALARSLAEADGGRLIVRRAGPRPVFALLLPAADVVFAAAAHPHYDDQSSTS